MADIRSEIQRIIEEVIAPLIHADDGEIHLVEASEEVVAVHLTGRYAGCPGNTLAHRRVIEPAILKVAPNAQVNVTAGAIIPEGATLVKRAG